MERTDRYPCITRAAREHTAAAASLRHFVDVAEAVKMAFAGPVKAKEQDGVTRLTLSEGVTVIKVTPTS
jgi:hypothetical protein